MSSKTAKFFNREMSWLEFNQRVLDESCTAGIPLLERLKFLAITASNLDEFFMVRVGGLRLMQSAGIRKRDPAGFTPSQLLGAISRRVHIMVQDQYDSYLQELQPALAAAGICRVAPADVTDSQREYLEEFLLNELASVVTPMAVYDMERFPLLENLGLYMAALLEPEAGSSDPRYAVIPLGMNVRRFLTLPSESGHAFILIEDLVRLFIGRLFPGETVSECVAFRITRNADMNVRDEFASDLLEEMEHILSARKQSDCVRVEVEHTVSKRCLSFLKMALGVSERDVYRVAGPLDLADFMSLTVVEEYDELKYDTWPPQPSPDVDPAASIFEEMSKRHILLHHPYESFDPVLKLIQAAAADPDVLAIKQILYRTSRRSPIIEAIKTAALRGKYVTVIVELKARFDEARNIEWARELEQAGVQVIYGVKGLKTHAKLCIVVRREPQGVVRYLHFGTGNYNENTARLYTDISYLTVDRHLGRDASAFFNAITGYSQPQTYLKLAAAPMGIRDRLLELIGAEAERRRHKQKAWIMAKMNSLVDPQLIKAMYDASQAGVTIRLNVRGVCCLRPQVKGLSDNITVVSIIDRFLEHSRIFAFHQGGDEKVFISSADWMPRNLDRRVELLVPIDDAASRARLIAILENGLADTVKGRVLQPDGSYRMPSDRGARRAGSQELLYGEAVEKMALLRQGRRTLFEPHQRADDRH